MSALSDHKTALIAEVRVSQKSQKQRKATPRFQLWRTKLDRSTSNKRAAEMTHAIGYNGYVGSAAPIIMLKAW